MKFAFEDPTILIDVRWYRLENKGKKQSLVEKKREFAVLNFY